MKIGMLVGKTISSIHPISFDDDSIVIEIVFEYKNGFSNNTQNFGSIVMQINRDEIDDFQQLFPDHTLPLPFSGRSS